jgi:hypothetical protein
MKKAIVIALLLVTTSVDITSVDAQQESRSERRAPLANVEDLEPAVDVRAPRVARASPQAAPAPSPAPKTAAAAAATATGPARSTPAERPAARVMDSLDLGTTSITGNAELPKVLYIVPWKKSDLGDLVGRPVNTLLDEVLAPVDPAVFERHLSYYDSLYGTREE